MIDQPLKKKSIECSCISGKTENGIMSDIKQSLMMKGFNHENCTEKYYMNVANSQICAGGQESKKSLKLKTLSPKVSKKIFTLFQIRMRGKCNRN